MTIGMKLSERRRRNAYETSDCCIVIPVFSIQLVPRAGGYGHRYDHITERCSPEYARGTRMVVNVWIYFDYRKGTEREASMCRMALGSKLHDVECGTCSLAVTVIIQISGMSSKLLLAAPGYDPAKAPLPELNSGLVWDNQPVVLILVGLIGSGKVNAFP